MSHIRLKPFGVTYGLWFHSKCGLIELKLLRNQMILFSGFGIIAWICSLWAMVMAVLFGDLVKLWAVILKNLIHQAKVHLSGWSVRILLDAASGIFLNVFEAPEYCFFRNRDVTLIWSCSQ